MPENYDKIKDTLKEIFNNKELNFNKEFDDCYRELKPEMHEDLIGWSKDVASGKVPHTPITHKKFREFVLFINKIADKRVLVVKEKNKDYIEIHLGDHKHYDEQRERFGIKKGSKYY